VRLGVLKGSLFIYLVFGFFQKVNLAFFAFDYLVTLVEDSANVSHTAMRAVYPYVHTLIKINADNQLHNCVCGTLSIKMVVL